MLGEKIKEARKKFGLTQEELAEKLNVSRQAVAKWELNNGTPDIENLKAISNLFGTSIDILLNNDKELFITTIYEKIDLKDYGHSKGEQYLNILNKYFSSEWTIYILNFEHKLNCTKGLISLLTYGLSELDNLSSYYLAVKDSSKLLINIQKHTLEITYLNANTNIQNFKLHDKIFKNYGKLKR